MEEVYRSPPFTVEGYVAFKVRYADGKWRTVLQHREVVEQSLNRRLLSTEIVHHRNHDKSDNRLENLEILSSSTHGAHHAHYAEVTPVSCGECGKELLLPHSRLRRSAKKGRELSFCSRACAGRRNQRLQQQKTTPDPTTWVHGNLSTYSYRKCRCEACREANAAAKRKRVVAE